MDKVRRVRSRAPAPEALPRQEAQAKESFSGFAAFPRETKLNRAKACVFGSVRKAGLGWAIGLVLQPASWGSTGQGQVPRSQERRLRPGSPSKAKRPLGISVVLRGGG